MLRYQISPRTSRMIQRRSTYGLTTEVAVHDSRRKGHPQLSSNTIEKHASSSLAKAGSKQSSIVTCGRQRRWPQKSQHSFAQCTQLRGLTLNIGAAASL